MTKTNKPRGFACMTPEKRREIASKGGASVPADRRSFSQSHDLAATAGRKGGQISRRTLVPASAPVEPEAA